VKPSKAYLLSEREWDMRYQLSRLNNGLRILTVPMPSRQSAAVAIWIAVGSRFESKNISGVSHFLEHMLFKGTKRRTTRQIKESIEGVGGILNAFTGEEATCYYAKVMVQHVSMTLEVLADMVTDSVLAPCEILKERQVILEEIKMYKDQPAQYVHELMGELLWRDQPLGRPIAGSFESVSGVTRKQMMDYRNRFYHPKNILVTVSGSLDLSEVVTMTRQAFKRNPKNKK